MTPSPAPMDSASEGVIEQIVRIVRRRKMVFLQALIVVPLLALLLSISQDEQYTATATLLFRQAPEGLLTDGADTGFVDPAREAATNDELVALAVVADRAAEQLGNGTTRDDVLSSVSIDSGGEADIAKISATTESPDVSADMANAYGQAYIDFRRDADQAQVQSAIDLVTRSIEALTPEELAGAQGTALRDRLDRLELAQALQTGKAELVQRASPPSSPSAPKTRRNVVVGLLLGGLLGLGLAALLERIDRRIRTIDELEQLLGLPILARIPRSRTLARQPDAQLDDAAQTPEGEAFRVLRTNLRFFNVDRKLRSILVASPEPGDGKSTVARNLAKTMAEMGDNVVLVEADLHKGSAPHSLVVARPREGLSSVLVGVPLDRALTEVPVGGSQSASGRTLWVLPSGPVPPNPSELLESDRMRSLLAELQERFDVVIVDSPALGAVGDALALVPSVSGVLVVSGLNQTTRDAARNFRKQVALMGAQPIGAVANFTEVERGGRSYYYYRPDVVSHS